MQSNQLIIPTTVNKKSNKMNRGSQNCTEFINNHLIIKKQIKKENYSGMGSLKLYHLQGKTQHQVQRRNERERRRVQQVNKGYEDLAQRV